MLFEKKEYKERLAKVKSAMEKKGIDLLVSHDPANMNYLTGYDALDHLSNGRVEVGIGRGVYGREAVHMNIESDLKDQAKNKRLFQETLTVMKKA